jgi:hypothetical protein
MYRRGALIYGHYHTTFYAQEHLAEIFQKRIDGHAEEEKINQFLLRGVRLGIAGPTGLTAVWAERLERPVLFDALFRRRCYATTGARILIDLRVNGQPMGSVVEGNAFAVTSEILGTADIEQVDLVVNGGVAKRYAPGQQHVFLEDTVPREFSPLDIHYCYLRLRQRDGNRAWTSPVWLTGTG